MAEVMKRNVYEHETDVRWWCPGCKRAHRVPITGNGITWEFNGDLEKPTLSPSVLIYERKHADGTEYSPRCHTFIRDGVIQFLGDCTHDLAGLYVPLEPIDS